MQTVHLGSVNDALLQDSGIGGALRASTSITSRRPCRRPSHSCPRMTRNDKQRAVTCVSLTASGLLERVGTQAPTQKTQYRLKLEKKVKSNSFNFYPFWREWERERKEKNFLFFFSNHPMWPAMNQTGAPGYWHRLRHLLRHSPDFILERHKGSCDDGQDGRNKKREREKEMVRLGQCQVIRCY